MAVETTIINEKRLLGIYVITSLIGIALIVSSVFQVSRELEIVHKVDDLERSVKALLGDDTLPGLMHGGLSEPSDIRFYRLSDNTVYALNSVSIEEQLYLASTELESSRLNKRGGYFELHGNTLTWVKFKDGINGDMLLAVSDFEPPMESLLYAYRQNFLVPLLFYIWIIAWVAFVIHRLLRTVRENQVRISHMALYDGLTGLPNRNLAHDRFEKMIQLGQRESGSFSCSLVDLDGFKSVNDQWGHAYGDEVLRQAAARLQSCLRESDTAARIGGDEFVILLNHVDEYCWGSVYARVQLALSKPYEVFGNVLEVGASIGVAIYLRHGLDVQTLMRNADSAMYEAKAGGGGVRIYKSHKPPRLLGVVAAQ